MSKQSHGPITNSRRCRSDGYYAAIGTVSNVASRLCDEAKAGQILVSPRVRQAIETAVMVEPVGEFSLKGIRRPMMAYNVLEASVSEPR